MSLRRGSHKRRNPLVRKILSIASAAALVVGVAGGMALSTAQSASAHTPAATDTCTTLSVNLTQYKDIVPAKDAVFTTEYQRYSWIGNPSLSDPATSSPVTEPGNWQADNKPDPGNDPIGQSFQQGNGVNASWFFWVANLVETSPATPAKVNTVTVSINGTQVDSAEFGASFIKDYTFTDSTIANSWSVTVVAWDGPSNSNWSKTITGTSEPCVPVDSCPVDFTSPAMWEINWGTSFDNRNGVPTFTTASNGGMTSLNGAALPSYMTNYDATHPGQNWHWLYVNKPVTNFGWTYGFADGTVRTSTITADSNGCPSVVWGETPPPPPPTVNVCTSISNGGVSTNVNPNGWTFGETRTAGTNTYVNGGLEVETTPSAGGNAQSKAAGYHTASNIPFADVGDVSMDYTYVSGVRPSIQIGFDKDGNGTWDGYLVYEPDSYGVGQWWSSKDFGVGAGGGYASMGTLDEYLQANPDARAVSFGYSLGSGVLGKSVIHSITFGCAIYTFDFQAVVEPSASLASGQCEYDENGEATPRSVVLTYDNSASNVSVKFKVTDHSEYNRTVPAGQIVTVTVTDAPASGVSYTVKAKGHVFNLTVEPCPELVKPEPKVSSTYTYKVDCDNNLTTVTTTSTVNSVFNVESQQWEDGEPVITEATETHKATNAELAQLRVEKPASCVPKLAYTGGTFDPTPWYFAGGMLLLGLGAVLAPVAIRRRRKAVE